MLVGASARLQRQRHVPSEPPARRRGANTAGSKRRGSTITADQCSITLAGFPRWTADAAHADGAATAPGAESIPL